MVSGTISCGQQLTNNSDPRSIHHLGIAMRIGLGSYTKRKRSLAVKADAESSTEQVGKLAKHLQHKKDEAPTNGRRVRFALVNNIFYENRHQCKEDCSLLWYTIEEIRWFREKKGYESNLCKTMEMSHASDPRSYANVMERIYQSLGNVQLDDGEFSRHLSQVDAYLFQFWIEQTVYHRLGLERAIVDPIGEERQVRRNEMLEKIEEIQSNASPHMKQEEVNQLICQACRAISQPSRLFATHLARVLVTVS